VTRCTRSVISRRTTHHPSFRACVSHWRKPWVHSLRSCGALRRAGSCLAAGDLSRPPLPHVRHRGQKYPFDRRSWHVSHLQAGPCL
jgi:hypothetical protein